MTIPATVDAVVVRRATPDADAAEWRRAADGLADAHLAHAPEWAGIIQRAYGHNPLYLSAVDGAGAAGWLPAIVVRRPLFGTVVSSMPFLDGGGPCGSSPAVITALADACVAAGCHLGAGAVELRSTHRLAVGVEPTEHKVNLVLPLPEDADRLWQQLDKSVRNQVRKAERSGMSMETGSLDKLDAFYAIHTARMHDLGSPPHDRRFFRAVLEDFGGRARIVLIRKGSTVIGGLMALAFKDSITVPWASCLKEHFAHCPNMLLYWETIRSACRDGYRRFDFGRSTRGSGTYRFKRQWGAVETPLFWYRIPIGSQPVSTTRPPSHRADRCLVGLWQRLPRTLTRSVGPFVRRYLIQ